MKRAVYYCIALTALLSVSSRMAFADNDKVTTIAGLNNIQQIGSSEFILDLNGNPIDADSDPYKIAIAPENLAPHLKKGDVLVSNVGNDVGTTIVKFRPFPSTGVQFNAANAGVQGPSGLNFDKDKLLVANSKRVLNSNNNNSVQILNPDGTLFTSIKDPLFNNPWSVSTGFPFSFAPVATFFTTNKGNAKILRVDVIPNGAAVPAFHVVQIGQFTPSADGKTKIDVLWMPFLKVGSTILTDVLLASDPVNNRLAAFAGASTLSGTGPGTTVFQGPPIVLGAVPAPPSMNVPGGMAVNPFNNDILVVNLNDNNLIELNLANGTVVAVKTIDPLPVDAAGNNSALFGVAATMDPDDGLRVYFTDDNTNTLNVLSRTPLKANPGK